MPNGCGLIRETEVIEKKNTYAKRGWRRLQRIPRLCCLRGLSECCTLNTLMATGLAGIKPPVNYGLLSVVTNRHLKSTGKRLPVFQEKHYMSKSTTKASLNQQKPNKHYEIYNKHIRLLDPSNQ